MANMRTRTREGGSVVSFLVVGAVLVVVMIGGIYLLQKRGDNAAGPSPAVTTSSSPTPSPQSSSKPGVSPSSTPVVGTPRPSSSPIPPQTGNGAIVAPMPTTGPADSIPAALMAATLLGSVLSYIQSRRARTQA